MKRVILSLICSLVLNNTFSASEHICVNHCQIFGSIFVEERKTLASFTVFVEDSEGISDLVVFEQESDLLADATGLWYFTEERMFSDYRIYITTNKDEADFTIFFTDLEDYATCN